MSSTRSIADFRHQSGVQLDIEEQESDSRGVDEKVSNRFSITAAKVRKAALKASKASDPDANTDIAAIALMIATCRAWTEQTDHKLLITGGSIHVQRVYNNMSYSLEIYGNTNDSVEMGVEKIAMINQFRSDAGYSVDQKTNEGKCTTTIRMVEDPAEELSTEERSAAIVAAVSRLRNRWHKFSNVKAGDRADIDEISDGGETNGNRIDANEASLDSAPDANEASLDSAPDPITVSCMFGCVFNILITVGWMCSILPLSLNRHQYSMVSIVVGSILGGIWTYVRSRDVPQLTVRHVIVRDVVPAIGKNITITSGVYLLLLGDD